MWSHVAHWSLNFPPLHPSNLTLLTLLPSSAYEDCKQDFTKAVCSQSAGLIANFHC